MKVIHPFIYREESNDFLRRIKGRGYVVTYDILIPLPQLKDRKRQPKLLIQDGKAALDQFGNLTLTRGFFWNGSNWSIDAVAGILAALVHDALSEMCNEFKPKRRRFSSRQADKIYAEILDAQGPDVRSWYHYPAVRLVSFWRWVTGLFTVALVACGCGCGCGCCRITVDGDWVHRGQHVQFPTNATPATVNVENMQEGSEVDGSLNAIGD